MPTTTFDVKDPNDDLLYGGSCLVLTYKAKTASICEKVVMIYLHPSIHPEPPLKYDSRILTLVITFDI